MSCTQVAFLLGISQENVLGSDRWLSSRVCLLIAKVVLEGPFSQLHTEAEVSENLPVHFLYIFSNRSAKLLEE